MREFHLVCAAICALLGIWMLSEGLRGIAVYDFYGAGVILLIALFLGAKR
jgi:hypothetical protein